MSRSWTLSRPITSTTLSRGGEGTNNLLAAEAKAIKIRQQQKRRQPQQRIIFSRTRGEGNIILSRGRGEGDIILGGRSRGRDEDNSTFSSNNDNVTPIGGSRNNFEGIRKHLECFIF